MKELATSAPWPTLLAGAIVLALVSIVGFTVKAILKGDLVPREQVSAYKAAFERELAEHEKTRDAMLTYLTHEKAGIEAARLAADVMQGIKANSPAEPQ